MGTRKLRERGEWEQGNKEEEGSEDDGVDRQGGCALAGEEGRKG